MAETESPFYRGRMKDQTAACRRREEILAAAIGHFARDGFNGADLNAIAADAGCAKGTLFNYFPTKGELFGASVDLVMDRLLEATDSDCEDPVERLGRAIRAFLGYFRANPEYVELLIQERAHFRDRQKPTYIVYREKHRERWRGPIERAIDRGIFRPMPTSRAMDVVGDLLYGMLFANHYPGNRRSPEEQETDVLDMIFHALMTPEAAARLVMSYAPTKGHPRE